MWTVWIFWSVRVCMMHSMKYCISSWGEVGATLPNPSEKIKKLFPILVHDEHLMRCVAVEKEALAKQGEIPMEQKDDDDDHRGNFK